MKEFTETDIRQRAIDWNLDVDSEDDLKLAEESLYCDRHTVAIDVLNDGVI